MNLPLILAVYLALAALMAAAWWWQRRVRNIGWVDVFWTFGVAGAGAALAFGGADDQGSAARRLLVCALIVLWSLRLGLYVAVRVAGSPEDGRYRQLRQSWGGHLQPRMFWFLQLQAVVSILLALAIGLAANRPGPNLTLADLAGVMIALGAMLGEGLADQQMKSFRATSGEGAICDLGLWGWSRHPNYVFEWLGWLAYPVLAISLSGAYPLGWLSLLAPLCMFGVLRFGTGVPPLEEHMARTRGAAFDAYKARVPIFLPRIFKENGR